MPVPTVFETLDDKTEATTAAPTDRLYIFPGADRKITVDNFHKSRTGNYSILVYSNSLSAAVSGIGSTQATLEIPFDISVPASMTVPTNILLVPTGSAKISVASGQTLTIHSPSSHWPLRQLFTGAGNVVFGSTSPVTKVYPQWWGAKGNTKIVTDASVSGTTLTSATAAFTSAITGMKFDVSGAGAADEFSAIITAFTDSTHVEVSVPASYTASGQTIFLDAATIATGSMTAGDTTLVAGSAFFTADDVGKLVRVNGVGARNISGTLTYVNSTTATMSVSAAVAVSGRILIFGTDDHAAIAAALASLPTGGEIFFPKGKYVNGSALAVNVPDLTWSGTGMNSSEVYMIGPKMNDAGSVYHSVDITTPASNIHFEGLGFSGTNWTAQGTLFGVDIADCVYVDVVGPIRNISANNCRFDSSWGIGFHNPGSSGSTYVSTTAVNDIRITNCQSQFNSADGLNPNPRGGLIVANCKLNYNRTGGMEASTSQGTITGNVCLFNGQGGLSIGGYGDPEFSSSITVSGNTCNSNGLYGISLASNQANTSVTGNTCRNNGDIGIDSPTGGFTLGKNSVIGNNILASNGRIGLNLGQDNLHIVGNKIFDEGTSQQLAVLITGAGCKLFSNEISTVIGTDLTIQGANTYLDASNVYDPTKVQMSLTGSLVSPVYRGSKAQVSGVAVSLFEIQIPTLTSTSGIVKYRIYAGTGGEVQVRSGIMRFSASNKAGSYFSETSIISEGASNSTGTLTGTWGIVTGTNKITLQSTATSSIFGNTTIQYTVELDSSQPMVVL